MRHLALVLIPAYLFSTPRIARADVYSDATDIIRALIERNIAQEVVPNLASKVPMLCDYFPASMAALQEVRFNGLPNIIHKEIADAIGFKVLLAMRPPSDHPPVLTKLSADALASADAKARQLRNAELALNIERLTLGASAVRTPDKKQELVGRCNRLPPPASAEDAPSFAGLESIATEALAQCVSLQSDRKDEIACSLALLVRDATLLEEAGVIGNLQRAATALVVSILGDDVKDVPRVTMLLAQALRAEKIDRQLVDQLVNDKLIGGTAEKAWIVISALVDAQREAVTLEGALALVRTLADVCKDRDVCKLVLAVSSNAEVQRMLKQLSSRDYGGAAQSAAKVLVSVACVERPCSETDKLVLRFVEKLTVYTIDSIQSGTASSSVSADFRAAATDLIEQFSGPGVYGYAYSKRGILMPRFALRRASRPGRGSLDLVDYPSVDAVTLRWVPYFTEWLYVSPAVSLFDLVGPFTELAVRAEALNRKGNADVFLRGFIAPRIELELGVPALTNNLVIGAGVGLRFYRAEAMETGAEYCLTWGDSLAFEGGCAGDDTWNANNLEYSIFIKYVP